MVGTDTWVTGQWDNDDELIASNRLWLPLEIAERLAFRNAQDLFGRDVEAVVKTVNPG